MKNLLSMLKMPRGRKQNAAMLYIAVLLTGSCGLTYEYTVSKVASDLLGNSTRQWAMIIGVMMFFMGLGANQQKTLGQRNLLAWFALLEMLLSLLGGLSPLLLLWAYAYWQSHYILWQYLLIAAIGFLIGLEIPIITRINENFTPELKVNIGRTLQMDYIGALGGAVLWSYWLLPNFPLSRAAVLLGFANMSVTWLFIAYFYQELHWRRSLLLLSLAFSAVLLWAYIEGPKWSLQTEQGLYRDPIVYSRTTPYQHLVLTRSSRTREAYFDTASAREGRGQGAEPEYRLYINGHIQFSSLDEFIYHENLVHPAFALYRQRSGKLPQRVLILGGGDGLALREVRKYPSVQEAILCDLDPEILRFAAQNPVMRRLNDNSLHGDNVLRISPYQQEDTEIEEAYSPPYLAGGWGGFSKESLPNTRVILRSLDAARYIEQVAGLFDVIIADFPDPNNESLSKLYSLSFYHNVRRKLSPQGVFVQQSTSPVYASKAFWAIGRTMLASGLQAFPYHDFVPSFGEWGWWLAGTTSSELEQQYTSMKLEPVPLRYLSDQIIQANAVFPASFQEMYRNSLTLFPASNSGMDTDTGALYRSWVTTLTQAKVYQYYLESAW